MFNRDNVKVERLNKRNERYVIYDSLACNIQDDRSRTNVNPPFNQTLLKKMMFVNSSDIIEDIKDKDIITNLKTLSEYSVIGDPFGGNIIKRRLQIRLTGSIK